MITLKMKIFQFLTVDYNCEVDLQLDYFNGVITYELFRNFFCIDFWVVYGHCHGNYKYSNILLT